MREIKFRAWDGKRMDGILGFAYNHQSRYDLENNIKTISVYFNDRNYEVFNIGFNKNVELMQYTGLKDKNGKEIYEGDIMQHENPFDIPFTVNYNNDAATFEFNDGYSGYAPYDPSFHIIGNIYENPELL